MQRFSQLVSILFLIIFTGCKFANSTDNSVIEMKIEPKTSEFYGMSPTPIESMTAIVSQSNDTLKLRLNEIDGFEYEKGYIWILKVKKEKISNPPADASDTKYKLIKIISKTKE